MKKEKIIVTGGAGYIGAHTVVELIQQDYEVIIADNLSNSSIKVLDGILDICGEIPTFCQLDLTDEARTVAFFKKHMDAKAVIHFAALKAVGESTKEPILYYKNNLVALINVLDCLDRFNIPHFIFSSSATVYGQPKELPATEDSPVQPASSPYGSTKQMAEVIIKDTVNAGTKLKSAISLRYFNPIGAHPSGLIGELPQGVPNNLMPFVTQTAAGIRPELKVFGNDYDTHDGTCIRDYIHVVDLAKAHVKALERLIKRRNKEDYEVFNLGTGNGFSVLDVIKSFEKMSGKSLNYSFADRRPGDIESLYASTNLANQELGWNAALSLDEMTASAWEWEKKLRNNAN